MVKPTILATSSARLALSLWAIAGASACAELETSPSSEHNPFEVIQPEREPSRRLAQIQVVLRDTAEFIPAPSRIQNAAGNETQSQEESLSLYRQAGTVPSEDQIKAKATTSTPRVTATAKVAAESPFVPTSNPLAKAKPPALEILSQPPAHTELDVRGDFAAFRGVEERLVWAFAGLTRPAWSELQVGDCMGVSAASRRMADLPASEAKGTREIELLDLGRFEIQLGDQRFDVPMHLTPGVLPYASGVQYRGEHRLPASNQPPSRSGYQQQRDLTKDIPQIPMSLKWQGPATPELPGARVEAPLPAALKFKVRASAAPPQNSTGAPAWYDLTWTPSPSNIGSRNRLYLHARIPSEFHSDTQVVCRLPDRGDWQLDLEELADEGLDLRNESGRIELELRRVSDFNRKATGFEQVRLRVERSEQALIPARADKNIR